MRHDDFRSRAIRRLVEEYGSERADEVEKAYTAACDHYMRVSTVKKYVPIIAERDARKILDGQPVCWE